MVRIKKLQFNNSKYQRPQRALPLSLFVCLSYWFYLVGRQICRSNQNPISQTICKVYKHGNKEHTTLEKILRGMKNIEVILVIIGI